MGWQWFISKYWEYPNIGSKLNIYDISVKEKNWYISNISIRVCVQNGIKSIFIVLRIYNLGQDLF